MKAYQELMGFERDTQALAQVAGRLGWDQETVMPRGAAEQRVEESGAMEAVLHARRTDPRVGEWLEKIEENQLDEAGQAQVRLIRRAYGRACRVPADLATALAKLTSRSQGIWAEARKNDDFAAFSPVLQEVVKLRREEGAALAQGGDTYDALLDGYEPGCTAEQLDAIFGAIRPRLVALRERALEKDQGIVLKGEFDEGKQLALSRRLAETFGYDLSRGRIDKAVHPFSSGSGLDVRITTRTDPRDPFNCLYSTIHEVGHACYEQAIEPEYLLTPLGQGASMGVHESQSRIYENQLGRSRAFCGWLYGQMRDAFGDLGLRDEEEFFFAVNRIHRGYIRTESDEVQYNLHIMLRYDLERALMAGDLPAADLENAWNQRFKVDFGYEVDHASNGVLQDVHWSLGLFGYFPTYSLGNVYAGCLFDSMNKDLPGLDAALEKGDLVPATGWLRQNVQQFGGLHAPREVISRACGTAPSAAPLLEYLEAKFGAK